MAGDPVIIRLVVPGGTADVEAFIVGELREVRVDESNDSLRLHDGVKEGGYEFLNRDASDVRYQPRSLELDGFDFTAQGKGIVTRVGPASYKLRRLTAHVGEFAITNPSGTAGNFYFELLEQIETPHTWVAAQTFLSAIDATTAGLDGPTRGVHTGDVVGNVTGNLTGDANGNHTGTFTGDVDVSTGTLTTAPGQITEDQIDPNAWVRRGLPQGAIVMWSGLESNIPASFALCDGANGTPDLRDRFIVGAGGAYAAGAVGGSQTHQHTSSSTPSGAHSHPVTVGDHALTESELPAHSHHSGITYNQTTIFPHGTVAADPPTTRMVDGAAATGTIEGVTSTTGSGAAHTHSGSETTESGAHVHDISVAAADSRPPYYALCYIMKTV